MAIAASVFVATSLDGFIAREDGSIDWLNQANLTAAPGQEFGFESFILGIDCVVMGRRTFEQMLTFGEWPYGERRMVVLSRRGVVIPEAIRRTVSVSAEPPRKLTRRLESEGIRHLYVDGGQVIQAYLAAGLISEIIVTVIPVLLGSGKRLFGALTADVMLQHLSTCTFSNGFVQNRYRVERGAERPT